VSAPVGYRWDVEAFLRAVEAGVFTTRVELVEGDVWAVVLGDWHGAVTFRVAAALAGEGDLTGATLPSAGSLPDPDVWVRRPGAEPLGNLSPRLSRWAPQDVLLVVEVSDESLEQDLGVKADLYARTGYPRYWVVARDGVHEHTDPTATGYGRVRRLGPGASVDLPSGRPVPVDDLLGS